MHALSRRPFLQRQEGGVATMTAMSLLVLATVTAAAVNMTRITSTSGELQDLVDAAALGAAMDLREGRTTEQAIARLDSLERPMRAAMQGEGAVLTLTVNALDPANVTVSGRQQFHVVLGGLLRLPQISVARRATAIADGTTPVCLLLLDSASPGAWSLGGSSKVRARDCVGQVNSSAANAIADGGSASASMLATHVVGPPSELRRFHPVPLFEQKPLSDPYAGRISWPGDGACPAENQSVSVSHSPRTLRPGVYCGGLSFGAGARAQLEPGVYVIKSGGVTLGANAEASGLGGVTLVLTDPAGKLSMDGNSTLRLAAPTAGPWQGIAMAQRPGSSAEWSMTGSSRLELQGMAYLPSQTLSMTGNSSLTGPQQPRAVVAKRLRTHGSADLDLASGPGLAGRPGGVRLAS